MRSRRSKRVRIHPKPFYIFFHELRCELRIRRAAAWTTDFGALQSMPRSVETASAASCPAAVRLV
ncbi:protein of unknown function [Burkholderia multivorans]